MKHRKITTIFALLLAALLCVSSLALAEGTDDLAAIQAKGTLVIGTEGGWEPWTYHDENDHLTGFDVEIARLIAAGLGVEAEFAEAEWGALLAGLDSKRFDIVCNGVDYTEERAEKYAFTIPYVYNSAVLVVRGDNESIQSVEDLAGKKTTNSPASTYAQIAEANGATVVYIDTLGETIEQVLSGRADATINAKESIESYLEEHPEANLKIVQEFPGSPVAYPIRKGAESESLLEAINAILTQAHEDGSLSALSIQFFGEDLTKPESAE